MDISGLVYVNEWAIPDRLWDTFSGKGVRTVFLSIGSGASSDAELAIAESIGCPVHAVCLNGVEENEWENVKEVLADPERTGARSTCDFSKGAEKRWILPKNIRKVLEIPYWSRGVMDTSGCVGIPLSRSTQAVAQVLEKICSDMKLKDNTVRCDILKVDTVKNAPGRERAILSAFFQSPFRPAIVLINWTDLPDSTLEATMAAGQLQLCGYKLIAKSGHKFTYTFTDNDMYQICSWEDTTCDNPMMRELVNAGRELERYTVKAAARTATATATPSSLLTTEAANAK